MKTYLVNLNENEMKVLVDAPELSGWHDGKERKAYITAKAKLLKVLSTLDKRHQNILKKLNKMAGKIK